MVEKEWGLWAAMDEKVWGLLGCWEDPEDGVGEGSDDGGVVMLVMAMAIAVQGLLGYAVGS